MIETGDFNYYAELEFSWSARENTCRPISIISCCSHRRV